jgi:hypothetical protein
MEEVHTEYRAHLFFRIVSKVNYMHKIVIIYMYIYRMLPAEITVV